jgi:hypothetical protein
MGAVDERAAGPASSTGRDGFGWAALAFTSATVVVCLLCATMVWLLPGCPGRLGAPALPLPLWVVDLGTALVLAGLGHVAHQRLARAGGGARALSVLPPAIGMLGFVTQVVPLNIAAVMC